MARTSRGILTPTVPLLVVRLLLPSVASAQGFSLFGEISKLAAGFSAAKVYYSPLGGVWHSDVIEAHGQFEQYGLAFRSDTLDLSIGVDFTTGFGAVEPSLDLRGSIRTLPTVTKYFAPIPLHIFCKRPMSLSVGLNAGLSQLQDVRTQIRESPDSSSTLALTGSGFHLGASLGLSVSFGRIGTFLDASIRYQSFPSLDWRQEGKSVVPPVEWPLSMRMWIPALRVGFGLAKPAPDAT